MCYTIPTNESPEVPALQNNNTKPKLAPTSNQATQTQHRSHRKHHPTKPPTQTQTQSTQSPTQQPNHIKTTNQTHPQFNLRQESATHPYKAESNPQTTRNYIVPTHTESKPQNHHPTTPRYTQHNHQTTPPKTSHPKPLTPPDTIQIQDTTIHPKPLSATPNQHASQPHKAKSTAHQSYTKEPLTNQSKQETISYHPTQDRKTQETPYHNTTRKSNLRTKPTPKTHENTKANPTRPHRKPN